MAEGVEQTDLIPKDLMRNKLRPIPADFWRVDGINWFQSLAMGETKAYYHIQVDCDQLLELFPIEAGDPFDEVRLCNGQLLLHPEPGRAKKTGAGGRPPDFKWPELEDEALRRLMQGVPIKPRNQFYFGLQVWCSESGWSKIPKEPSIRARVGRYVKIRVEIDAEKGEA